ncbi:MAG TPA: HAD family hydrolase, partial [Caulobacter sp.]|nr:HAD family hydrolase [Caulobacter sp.]
AHEAAQAPADHPRYVELDAISELPAWVDRIAAS